MDFGLAMNPDMTQVLINNGSSNLRAGRFGEAERDFRQALGLQKDHFGALNLLTVALILQKRFDEAERYVAAARAQEPDDVTVLFNHAYVLRELGRYSDALQRYDEAIALAPNDAGLWNNRGLVLHYLRRDELAIASFEQAITIRHDYPDPHVNRGNSLCELNQLNKALDSYERCLVIDPNNADAHYGRGLCLRAAGQFAKALASFDDAIRLNSELQAAFIDRNSVLRELGRSHEQAWSQLLWFAMPMNGQAGRIRIACDLIEKCGIRRIVETGTYLGATTEFFANLEIPIVTAENHPEYARRARQRLRRFSNIDLRAQDSLAMLADLTREPLDHSAPTLFYLDAHWQECLPLRQEIDVILAHFSSALIIIDDFAVPGDAGYKFDDYGAGKRLDMEYLLEGRPPIGKFFFPAISSREETGSKRGCVIMTASFAFADILKQYHLLREWIDDH